MWVVFGKRLVISKLCQWEGLAKRFGPGTEVPLIVVLVLAVVLLSGSGGDGVLKCDEAVDEGASFLFRVPTTPPTTAPNCDEKYDDTCNDGNFHLHAAYSSMPKQGRSPRNVSILRTNFNFSYMRSFADGSTVDGRNVQALNVQHAQLKKPRALSSRRLDLRETWLRCAPGTREVLSSHRCRSRDTGHPKHHHHGRGPSEHPRASPHLIARDFSQKFWRHNTHILRPAV